MNTSLNESTLIDQEEPETFTAYCDGRVVQVTQEELDDDYVYLDGVGEYHHCDDVVSVRSRTRFGRWENRDYALISDVEQCPYTREYYYPHDMVSIEHNGDTVEASQEYADENTFYCDSCNTTYHHDHYGDNGCCTTCAEENDNSVADYHSLTRPAFRHWSIQRGFFRQYDEKVRYYGVEIECELVHRDSDKDSVIEWSNGLLIAELDGSLDDDSGIEFISAPMPLEAQKVFWSDFTAPRGARGHNAHNAGMHVHVSLATISTLTHSKVNRLINKAQTLTQRLGQREFNGYCRLPSQKKLLTELVRHKKHGYDCEKYQVVANRGQTLEFRFFKSNLRPERIIKNLEVVDSMITYCENTSYNDIAEDGYLLHITTNPKKYPALVRFIQRLETDSAD